MEMSILKSTKKILGLDAEYTPFDLDIMTHINSALFVLTQNGIGPSSGFMIESDSEQWDEFVDSGPQFVAVKTYVYLQVRLLFDPPATGYLVTALQEQSKEFLVRLNIERENQDWVAPVEPVTPGLFRQFPEGF